MGMLLTSAPTAGASSESNLAASGASGPPDAAEICSAEHAAETVAVTENVEASALIDQVLADVQDGTYTLHASQSDLEAEEAEATTIEADGEEYSSVTIPISGDYGMASNLTVVFDDDGSVQQYAETLHSENAEGNVAVESYSNGELAAQEDTDTAFMTRAELQEKAQKAESGDEAVAQSGGTVACVATTLGIGTVAAGTIVALCGSSCSVPATPPTAKICAACIGGIVTIAGSTTAFTVMGCFN